MMVRPDIAELLRAGYSDRAIGRQLNVDPVSTVAAARRVLGLPKHKPGVTPAASPEDLFWRRATPTGDGHMDWGGYRDSGGAPSLRHGGRNLSAYRIAYRLANGREPEGRVLPSCGRNGCVQPGHHSDRTDRARDKHLDALYDGIFGGGS